MDDTVCGLHGGFKIIRPFVDQLTGRGFTQDCVSLCTTLELWPQYMLTDTQKGCNQQWPTGAKISREVHSVTHFIADCCRFLMRTIKHQTIVVCQMFGCFRCRRCYNNFKTNFSQRQTKSRLEISFAWILYCNIYVNLDMQTFICILIMAVLRNKAGHYIFVLWFLLLLSFSSFFLAYSQTSQIGCLPYFHTWCGLSVNFECRSDMCCTRLAEIQDVKLRKKIAIWAPSHNFVGLYFCN